MGFGDPCSLCVSRWDSVIRKHNRIERTHTHTHAHTHTYIYIYSKYHIYIYITYIYWPVKCGSLSKPWCLELGCHYPRLALSEIMRCVKGSLVVLAPVCKSYSPMMLDCRNNLFSMVLLLPKMFANQKQVNN